MKAIFCALTISLLPLAALAAQELSLNAPVEYDIDLYSLYQAAVTGDDNAIPRDKLLIMVGTIGSSNVIEDEEESFLAEIELVGGHWNGEESIELYRASFLFDGISYRSLFERRGSERFTNGEKLLLVAEYLGLDTDYTSDELIPVLRTLYFRRIR